MTLSSNFNLKIHEYVRTSLTQKCNLTHCPSIICEKVKLRQDEDEVLYQVVARGGDELTCDFRDETIIREYFNLSTSTSDIPSSLSRCDSSPATLSQLSDFWAARDERFAAVRNYFPGKVAIRINLT
jgi:hypothetical protein